jgi:hypothetical protein
LIGWPAVATLLLAGLDVEYAGRKRMKYRGARCQYCGIEINSKSKCCPVCAQAELVGRAQHERSEGDGG